MALLGISYICPGKVRLVVSAIRIEHKHLFSTWMGARRCRILRNAALMLTTLSALASFGEAWHTLLCTMF